MVAIFYNWKSRCLGSEGCFSSPAVLHTKLNLCETFLMRVYWEQHFFPPAPSLSFGLPQWLSGKKIHLQGWRYRRLGLDPWVREIPWRRGWQPTPVFLPGESHGQRSLTGYSLYSHKQTDTTETTEHISVM